MPVLAGTTAPTTLDDASAFFASLGDGGAVMIKALAGGGGRGMRVVDGLAKLDEAYERCQSEAKAAFGNGDVYVEQLMPRARHIEVQIVGDGTGDVSHLWERECSIQRRNQKIVEIAPSPSLTDALRMRDRRRRPCSWRRRRTTTVSAPSNSWSTARRPATHERSPSSRPTRGFRSSTR